MLIKTSVTTILALRPPGPATVEWRRGIPPTDRNGFRQKEPPMTHPGLPSAGGSGRDGAGLRLLWPQWQGAGTSSVRELAPEFAFDTARRAYAVGSAILAAILPGHDGPTAVVPVAMDQVGLQTRDGIEAKDAILSQLARALEVIRAHDPAR